MAARPAGVAMSKRSFLPFLLVVLLLGGVSPVFAQKITGDITGTVTDPAGAVVPGATVTAENVGTGLSRSAKTAATGDYRLVELPPGTYKVTVSATGFKTAVGDVQVAIGIVTHADFSLQVGERTETVTVEATSPLIELSDRVNSYVDEKRIVDLPLSGRDFNSLLAITPGVQRAPGGGFLAVNINGLRPTMNNYLVDGIPNNDRYYGDSVLNQTGVVGIPATLVPMDAIQEFTVQQNPSNEFGVKGGAAINVAMKSGTNELHGSAYYFRHDDWTDARNFFADEKTPLRNQQFGFTIGGPVRKDRTFFFAYYEGQRMETLAPYEAAVPTPAEVLAARARIAAAGLTTNPVGEALLAFYPTDPTGIVNVAIPNSADMNSFSVKLDHRIGEKHLVVGRYFFGDSLQSAPAFVGTLAPPAPNPPDMFNSVAPTRAQLLGLSWTWNLSPEKILETRFGLSRFSQIIDVNNKVNPLDLGINTGPLSPEDFGVPAVYYLGYFGYIGGVAGYPITTRPNQSYDLSQHFSLVRGRHTFKVGGQFQHAYTNSLRNRSRLDMEIFSTGADAIVQLLLGRFDFVARSFGSTRRLIFQNSAGFYFMDDWKLHPRLTLSYGLRYDVSGAMGEERDRCANFLLGDPLAGPDGFVLCSDRPLYGVDKNNFGPRVGIAWDVTGSGRTALRAGYSLSYDVPNFGALHAPRSTFSPLAARAGAFTQITENIFSVELGGDGGAASPESPLATCVDPTNPGLGGNFVCVLPGVSIFGPNPTGTPPFDVFSVVSPLKMPMIHYVTLSLQHELFKDNVVTVSYVGTRGRNLLIYRDLNASPIGSGGTQADRPLCDPASPLFNAVLCPQVESIIQLTNVGKSWYDSLQLSFRQRNWRGLNAQYNLTWGKCIDYGSRNRGTRINFPQMMNPFDITNNKGLCDHDVPLNFNVAGTYAIPAPESLGRFGKGWELGTVFTAMDGRPFTPHLGSLDRSGQQTGTIRANCNGTPQYNPRDPNQYIANPGIFSIPPAGTVGTCGRNILRGPGLVQWDFSVLKNTRFGKDQRYNIQFRWEIFNLLNRANFSTGGSFTAIGSNIRFSDFGTISSTDDVAAFNPVIAQGGPRSMQFVLKFIF